MIKPAIGELIKTFSRYVLCREEWGKQQILKQVFWWSCYENISLSVYKCAVVHIRCQIYFCPALVYHVNTSRSVVNWLNQRLRKAFFLILWINCTALKLANLSTDASLIMLAGKLTWCGRVISWWVWWIFRSSSSRKAWWSWRYWENLPC